jgi:ElaB/YqjD/DUF883 family membrane-anchored ribosome-binding protein
VSAERRAADRARDIAERLDALVDEIDEVSFDLLRETVAEGASTRPSIDRTLTQARRAMSKASALLRGGDD